MYQKQLLLEFRFIQQPISNLVKAAEFSNGVKFAVAALVPLLISAQFEHLSLGISMAIGVLVTSPSDVPGSQRRRSIAISLSIVIAVVSTILAGFSATTDLLFVPVLVLLLFSISMLSVYGFRASLIAFSGLFAVVLSMTRIAAESGVLTHALFLGLGGIWYFGFSMSLSLLNRKKETDLLLAEAFDLTADYLEVRNKLFQDSKADDKDITADLVSLQTQINEKYESIREMLINRRRKSGRSGGIRKKLLIFSELVDILELGMANPVNVEKFRLLFSPYPQRLKIIQDLNSGMAQQLRKFSVVWRKEGKYSTSADLEDLKHRAWEAFRDFETELQQTGDREALLVYRNLLTLKERQYEKILSMQRLFKNWGRGVEMGLKRKDFEKFVTTRDYDLKTLQDNLDFKSPIFRHALRLTISMLAGFLLGTLFEFQNPYWILLTTLVIMRPGYALTRTRFKQRLYGTLIGAAVAVSIVLLFPSELLFGILAVITLVLAFSMIQSNYKAAAAFITLNVIFVYSLLNPDALEVIQYRVLDTLLGAGLAFVANKFLWPSWEYTTIHKFVLASLNANCDYLTETEKLYTEQQKFPVSYKLARKKAFLAIGDLNAAFQRMAQEPVTEKRQLEQTFRIVSLNQEFLSATASLGTFIWSSPTSKPSENFRTYMMAIRQNLDFAVDVLTGKLPDAEVISVETARKFYNEYYKDLVRLRTEERENGKVEISRGLQQKFQEVQLVVDQLKWLLEISENIKAVSSRSNIKPPL